MNKGILVWGYLSSFLLLLGAIFLNNGFIAGKVLYLLGFLAFNIGFLIPLFLLFFKETQENKIGIFLILGVLGFFVFLTGVSFFVVNWGGGIVLIYIGGGLLISAILTLIIGYRRFYETTIYSWFPVLVFGVFMIISLLTTTVNRQVMRVYNLNNHQVVLTNEIIQKQCDNLYQKTLLDDSLQMDARYNRQLVLVYENSQHLIENINKLKLDVIQHVEGKKFKVWEGDALDNLFHIQSNVEINSVTRYLLKRNNKASELKKYLDDYKQNLLNIISGSDIEMQNYIMQLLNTDPYLLSGRWHERSWELQNFYDLPLITVVNQLSGLQQKVLLAEKEMLSYLYFKPLDQADFVSDTTLLKK